ncbi:oligopeptide transport system substrate-binding protein [Pedobacter sp. UYEF25]
MKKLISYIFYFYAIVLSVACKNNASQENKRVFRLNLDQGLTSLDPAFARNQNAIWMTNQIFNGLVQIDSNLKTVPCIAKSWEVSSNAKTYTFHLRTDVFFQNDPNFKNGKGRNVLASDFAYSFYRLIDPKVASSGGWIFSDKVENEHSFVSLNDSTFQIRLTKPFPPLMNLLTSQYCSVVPKEVVTHYGKDFRSHPVGTGPFKFKYWKEGEILVLLKNDHYFESDSLGKVLPYLDAVTATFINDKQSGFMSFLKKDLDFYYSVDGSYRDDILTKSGRMTKKYQGKFQLRKSPYLCTEYVGILVDTNLAIVKSSPLRFKKVRQAINYSIDRAQLIKYLRNGIGIAATSGFIPKGMPGFDDDLVKGYDYNPTLAAKLLTEAGFPNGKGLPEITLNTTTTYKDLIEFIQGSLIAIGIQTKVDVSPSTSLRELMAKNHVNFFRGSWIADYADGENFLSVFYSKNKVPFGPNYTAFYNKKFDKLFEQSYNEPDDQKRFKLYQQMDQLVMDDSAVVPIFYDQSVVMLQNSVSGYNYNPLSLLILKKVRKN